ncbi:DUF3618 domain-containing protein [Actinomadura flavalba]|uniref:DUF3618 domain-containing protein n=1 Tax=Actinomadura flavalba TaxID=1120938 RepID=UPI00035F91D4|nr:DUF3618 domain-containing protein [Actinomadura flavalba]
MTDKPGGDGPSADELRADIERTREDLGDTVEALAAKADVPARAKEKAAQVKDETQQKVAATKEKAAGYADATKEKAHEYADEYGEPAAKTGAVVGGGVALALAGLAAWRWKRRRAARATLRGRAAATFDDARSAVLDHDLTEELIARINEGDRKARLQGAAAASAVLLAAGRVRRRRAKKKGRV